MRLRLIAVRLLLLGALQAHAFARQRPLLYFLGGGNAVSRSGVARSLGQEASPSPSPSPEPLPPSPAPPAPGPDDPDARAYEEMFVPLVLLACFLVSMAGLMSGLTLGLMSLDEVDIEILRRSGTERQKRLAQRIQPVLARPHVLLVTLLVCNAVAAEALPLVLDRLADPATAIVLSVSVVLVFGEIIPQAACSRYGLEIGASSAPFVQLLMWLTAPVSFPIGWVLDRVLGNRHTALFRRAELKALMDIHKEGQEFGGQLSADEVSIIKGALDMTHKTARHAMTPIDMVFMLPTDAVLNEDTLTGIMASGHSRIPVHPPGDRSTILGIMLVKELLLVDRDQGKTVGHQKVRSLPAVRADTPLYDMLKLFEIGRSHMAVLMQLKKEAAERRRKESEEQMMVRVDSMSDDPSFGGSDEDDDLLSPRPMACPEDFIFDSADFEPVGIITIEDVLEELLQVEILDETDKFVDNMQSTPVSAALLMRSLPLHLQPVFSAHALLPRIGGAAFMDPHGRPHMPGQLTPVKSRAVLRSAAGSPEDGLLTAAVGAADGSANGIAAVGVAADGGAGAALPQVKSPRRAALPPLSPQPLSPRSGAITPTGGGRAYKQGSLGASLVAEALRQELAAQLAAAAANGGGLVGGTRHRRARSRSLSPLPMERAHSRQSVSSPERLPRAPPAAAETSAGAAAAGARGGRSLLLVPDGGAARGRGSVPAQRFQQTRPTSQPSQPPPPEPYPHTLPLPLGPFASLPVPQQQQQDAEAGGVPIIFPGLRRTWSEAAQSGSSGTATPRLVMPLQPPPPRRSTNLSQRVQDQIDLLQPLLHNSGQSSLEEPGNLAGVSRPQGGGAGAGDRPRDGSA